MVRLMDSTTIDLNLNQFQWAEFRSTKAGIELHTVYDPEAADKLQCLAGLFPKPAEEP
jgi:hypothetical protein